MSEGRIVEQGTHNDLLEKQGAYYNLVSAQNIATVEAADDDEEAALDAEDEATLIRKMSTKEGALADPDDNIAEKLNRTTTTKSASSVALQNRKPEAEEKYGMWTLIKLIASFNAPEWKLMLIGLVFSAICGGGNPTQAGM